MSGTVATSFSPAEEDRMLKVCTRPWSYKKNVFACPGMIDNADRVRDSLYSPSPSPPWSGLGRLSRLPLEVLTIVCKGLDLRTLIALRHVSRRGRDVVSSIRPYRLLIEHALEATSVLLRTDMATYFTVDEVFEVFCASSCTSCHRPGRLVFMPLMTRVCVRCAFGLDAYSVFWVNKSFGRYAPLFHALKRRDLGYRSPSFRPFLVAKPHLTAAASILGVTFEEIRARFVRKQWAFYKPLALVAMPLFELEANSTKKEYCCKHQADPRIYPEMATFTKAEFIAHFPSCEAAKEYWRRWKEQNAM
jgi:hypothetical protein